MPHTVRYTFTGTQTRDLPLVVAGPADPVQGLLRDARVRPDHARSAARAPVPIRSATSSRAPSSATSAATTIGPRTCPSTAAASTSTSCATSTIATAPPALESFKAGAFDLREEFTARDWATGYDIPAVKEGRLDRLTLPDESPSGAQGFFLNTRRPKLADVRVRKALDYAFDFEWTNKNIFYGLYTRTESFFENSDMKAAGKPSPAELALLEPFRGQLPPEVFDEPYQSPVSDGSGQDRKLLREAGGC